MTPDTQCKAKKEAFPRSLELQAQTSSDPKLLKNDVASCPMVRRLKYKVNLKLAIASHLKMGKIATLVFASVVVFLVVTYLPGLPPYMEFTAQSITPPMELKGALALNERLNNAEHLLKGEIKGPESFAVHKESLPLSSSTLQPFEVSSLGVRLDYHLQMLQIVKIETLHQVGFWDEAKCGRPLGLKSGKDGYLYVADAYYGLYRVNTTTGRTTFSTPEQDPKLVITAIDSPVFCESDTLDQICSTIPWLRAAQVLGELAGGNTLDL
uniref:Adipocyte plasma membrane-associated protein n=1 Tax=Timema bartmani TaxID=61472 RepID=A0A7R9HWG6_9NEOP|nr:unnamed protein product [Timema bartmani]